MILLVVPNCRAASLRLPPVRSKAEEMMCFSKSATLLLKRSSSLYESFVPISITPEIRQGIAGRPYQPMAFPPRSPELIRMQSARSRTKIFPSPTSPLPVLAPLVMAAMVGSTKILVHGDVQTDLPEEPTHLFGSAVDFGISLLPPLPQHVGNGHQIHVYRFERLA